MTADNETPLAESIASSPNPHNAPATEPVSQPQAAVAKPPVAATSSATIPAAASAVTPPAVAPHTPAPAVATAPPAVQPPVVQPMPVQPPAIEQPKPVMPAAMPMPVAEIAQPAAAAPEVAASPVVPTSPVINTATVKPERKNLAEVIVVTSGKGGVGKTTTSASLACGLARHGKKVVVIDFDVGLRNLDLIMGCERRVVYDFVNVINNECNLRQALIKDKRFDNLFVLAASQTRDKDALTKDGVEKILNDLGDDGFDYIVCDSPAGIEKGAFLAMYFADRAVVVVNPEVSSVRDSDRILGLLSSKTRRAERGERVKEHLLLTRYSPTRVEKGDMLSIKDVQEILGLDVVGVIPEAPEVLQSSNSGEPVILDMNSDAGQAYDDAVARLLGEKRPLRFTTVEKKGFFTKLFGG